MKPLTIAKINRLNQEYYRRAGESFHTTRQFAWDTWPQLLPSVRLYQPLRALDIGCGNGRWFAFLKTNQVQVEVGIGIDSDDYFLTKARTALPEFQFIHQDIFQNIGDITGFNLVTAFGIWHHLPSRAWRFELLKMIAVAPLAIISCWQPLNQPKLKQKAVNPEVLGIEAEENDILLGREDLPGVYRYCHHFTKAEIKEMGQSSGRNFQLIHGSGNDVTNTYLVMV